MSDERLTIRRGSVKLWLRFFPTYSRVAPINCHGSTSASVKVWPTLRLCFLFMARDWKNSYVSLERSSRNESEL